MSVSDHGLVKSFVKSAAFHSLRFLFLLSLLPVAIWGKEAVVLSTDVGNEIDDQWAIAYMLTNPAFDVQGIVSAHAPRFPYPSAHATYEVLVDEVEHRMGMVKHPPLFEGSSLALADTRTPRPNSGVDFIVKTSQQYSKRNRLTVLTIGAATDVASAILQDPSIVDRIRVVAMAFRNLTAAGKEYNVENDPRAWQVILSSKVPVTIGCGDVCARFLTLKFEDAKNLISGHGAIGAWLWQEYQDWCFQHVQPVGKEDTSKSWVIWDIIVLAHERGMTTQDEIARPRLADDLLFAPGRTRKTISWITEVDSKTLWADFIEKLDTYERTLAARSSTN